MAILFYSHYVPKGVLHATNKALTLAADGFHRNLNYCNYAIWTIPSGNFHFCLQRERVWLCPSYKGAWKKVPVNVDTETDFCLWRGWIPLQTLNSLLIPQNIWTYMDWKWLYCLPAELAPCKKTEAYTVSSQRFLQWIFCPYKSRSIV